MIPNSRQQASDRIAVHRPSGMASMQWLVRIRTHELDVHVCTCTEIMAAEVLDTGLNHMNKFIE